MILLYAIFREKVEQTLEHLVQFLDALWMLRL